MCSKEKLKLQSVTSLPKGEPHEPFPNKIIAGGGVDHSVERPALDTVCLFLESCESFG